MTNIRDWTYLRKTRPDSVLSKKVLTTGPEAFTYWLTQADSRATGKPFKPDTWDDAPTNIRHRISYVAAQFKTFIYRQTGGQPPDAYIQHYAVRTTQDYIASSLFAGKIATVYDIGAGWGRMAFPYSNYSYNPVDANYSARYMQERIINYLTNPGHFIWIEDIGNEKPAHPALVLMIWSFHEMNKDAARLITSWITTLPAGSSLYFRGEPHKIAHNISLVKSLTKSGYIKAATFPWKASLWMKA